MTSSVTLILNGAEARLQAVCTCDGKLLFAQEWDAQSRGTEILTPALEQAFAHMCVNTDAIGRIVCVNGPGSFTGIRLVLSTAAALARVTGAQLAALDYMAVLAQGATSRNNTHVCVLTHARRGSVHYQSFIRRGTDAPPQPVDDVAVLPLADAAHRILGHGGGPAVVGSGLTRNRAFFAEHLPAALLSPPQRDNPTTPTLMELEPFATPVQGDIPPLYVRPCDAVDNLAAIAARRGMDAADAHTELDRLISSTIII